MTRSASHSWTILLGALGLALMGCVPRAPGEGPGTQMDNPWCGNGSLEEGEACDGEALGGQTCASATGATEGTLGCSASCELETSGCHSCGDGVVEGPEECEGDQLGVRSCQDLGFEEGVPYCAATCRLAGCFTCGDGLCAVDDGETALGCPADCGGWRDLDLGGRHGCAVTQAGRVYCWGENLHGQCGSGGRALPALSEGLFAVSGLLDVQGVSAGWAHSCAVRRDGQVFCWGSNLAGQLGLGPMEAGEDIRLVPGAVTGLDDVAQAVQVAAGADHSCVLTKDGAVYCFGRNLLGQLGDGSTEDRPSPVRVAGLPPARVLVAGHSVTCAVDLEGRAWCWGVNDAGQLGCGALAGLSRRDGIVFSPWPVPVLGLGAVKQLSLGVATACAVEERAEGEHPVGILYCWGANDAGQLGDGLDHQRCGALDCSPVPVEVPLPFQIARVELGAEHGCAALADGQVWCWGEPSRGRLGRGALGDAAEGCQLSGCLPAPLANTAVTSPRLLALGAQHACAVAADRSLFCWGANEAGQVGCGSSDCLVPYALVDRIVR